ncbi:MAG: toxin-activating lysine-acyltransferase [Sulfitobacter sp.]
MKLEHKSVDVTNDTQAYFNQMGKLALLIGTTPSFAKIPMDMGLSMIHASLKQKTYCLYEDAEGKPTAGLLWAHLDEENKLYYQRYGYLRDYDSWRSGDQLWLLNVVAGGGMIKQVFKDTMSTLFMDEKEAFMIRLSPSGRRRVVRITHSGAELHEVLPSASKKTASN